MQAKEPGGFGRWRRSRVSTFPGLTIQAGQQGLSRLYLQRLVTEGSELGIHVFLLCRTCNWSRMLEQLLREYPTCAFVVFTTGARGADWNLASLAQHPNLSAFGTWARASGPGAVPRFGRGADALCCAWGYSDASAASLPQQLEEIHTLGGLLVLLYADGAAAETRKMVHQKVLDARTNQAYPFVLMELTEDLLAIDQVISDDPCSLIFLADGRAVTPEGASTANIRTESLAQVFQKTLPKGLHKDGI